MTTSTHKEQAERLHSLDISHRVVAKDLNIAPATVSLYLRDGRLTVRLTAEDFPARLESYIEIKAAEAAHGKQVRGPKLRGRFTMLGVTLDDVAQATGVSRRLLKPGIYRGLWPDESTATAIQNWLEKQISTGGKKMLTKISLGEEGLNYWTLNFEPFTNEIRDQDDILVTKENTKAKKKLMNAVEKCGWTAITGPVGSGKTTMINDFETALAKRPDVAMVRPRIIEKQFLGAGHICDAILEDLGGQTVSGQRTLEYRARLVGRVLEEAFREGRKVVVIIDEAHLLKPDALLALKRIYEIEVDFRKTLSIILIGQQSLARQLKTNFTLAEVSQRVDLHELGGLNGALGSYVRHKLERAGAGTREIFEPSAIKAMAKKADTPLSVNNLAAAALITAQDVGEKTVTAQIIESIHSSV